MHVLNESSQRLLTTVPHFLPTTGTSGSFTIRVPFQARYMGVLNSSNATINVAIGQPAAQPADAIPFEPQVYLSIPIEDTNVITVFWSSSSALSSNNNGVVFVFSNITIPVQGGAMSSGGVASNVTVQNTVNTNATLQGTPNVAVTSAPAMSGSDYGSPAANHLLKVDASGIAHVTLEGTNTVTVANSTLANAGIVGDAQTSVGTAAVQLTIPTGARNVLIKNMDPNNTVYIGGANTVTSTTGFPIDPKQTFSFDADPTVSAGTIVVWAIASAAGTNVAIVGVK